MFEFSSRYGWWKSHAGWAERRDQALAERERMVERWQARRRLERSRLNEVERMSTFDKRGMLRHELVLTDRFTTLKLRDADERPTAARATYADYAPHVQELLQSNLESGYDLQDAHAALVECEQLLADLAFAADHTASSYIDERPDSEIEEEREALSHYSEALEDVSAGAYDLAMEDRIYGRPSGLTNFIREAVRDGWASVPDYTDATTNPVMVASDRGLMMAIDAEHRPTPKVVVDRDAASAYFTVQEHRRWVETVLLDLDEPDEHPDVRPVVTVDCESVPKLRQAWLHAHAAGDAEAKAHIERWGRMLTA